MRGGHAPWRACMRADQSCRACAQLGRRVGVLHPNSDLAGPSSTPIASNRLRSLPSKKDNQATEGASLSFLGRIRARSSHNVSRFRGATVFTGVGYQVRHPALQAHNDCTSQPLQCRFLGRAVVEPDRHVHAPCLTVASLVLSIVQALFAASRAPASDDRLARRDAHGVCLVSSNGYAPRRFPTLAAPSAFSLAALGAGTGGATVPLVPTRVFGRTAEFQKPPHRGRLPLGAPDAARGPGHPASCCSTSHCASDAHIGIRYGRRLPGSFRELFRGARRPLPPLVP